MGLAASQARLLFITSRQNDVSAKMQRVSNDNMVLARDSEEVSNKYNQMLASAESSSSTSSSLVDSSTVNPTNLTYDAMMGAEGAGKYTSPYIISTSSGQVVLSSSMMNKLTALGGATSGSSAKFVEKYPDAASFIKAVAGEDVAAAYDSGTTGDGVVATTSIQQFLNSLTGTTGKKSTTTTLGTDDAFNTLASSNTAIGSGFNSSEGITAWYGADEKIDNHNRRDWRNKRQGNLVNTSRSIKELYGLAGKKQGSIMLGSAGRASDKSLPDLTNVKANLNNLTNNIGSQLIKALTSLGFSADSAQSTVSTSVKKYYESYSNNVYWDEGLGDGDQFDKSSKWAEARKSALDYVNNKADDKTYDSGWNKVFDDANQAYNEGAVTIGMIASTGLHGIVATRCDAEGSNNSWQFTLNLGNLVQDIVNDIFNTMSGGEIYDTDYSGTKTVNQEKAVDLSIKSTKKTKTSEEKLLAQKADFYAKIYEQLASKGWVVDEDANDYSKLQEKIKNGTYTINGSGYQNFSNINEVAKTYTKEDAEAYWKVEMGRIQRKEKLLDKELTKLQTEYSSLTTDYESVKSIISQNVSRSFTYCQNG